jgi:hypothetical protein
MTYTPANADEQKGSDLVMGLRRIPGADDWLYTANPDLGGRTPVTAAFNGRIDEVVTLAKKAFPKLVL